MSHSSSLSNQVSSNQVPSNQVLSTHPSDYPKSSQSAMSSIEVQGASKNSECLPISVITTCYGRNRHLYNLLASLEAGSKRPAEVIIVNDDADKTKLDKFELNIVQIATYSEPTNQQTTTQKSDSLKTVQKNELNKDKINEEKIEHQIQESQVNQPRFDIGLNRNKGAEHAKYETLLFLDVDCIASYKYVEGLVAKINNHPTALLMGQPRYLERPLTSQEADTLKELSVSEDWLNALSLLNPYRHNLVAKDASKQSTHNDIERTQDYGAFWSLCFAIKRDQFERIGGFDTRYIGYGSEDTDFAFTARQLNIDFYLTDDVVYHQQHAVYRPPLNHLSSIAVNANLFFDKWQHWPMSGWLAEFADKGLIAWREGQKDAIKVIRQPSDVELKAAYYPNAPFV